MPARVLHQFPISHYCEKTRWHLDRKGLSYSVRNLFPGVHMAINRRLAGQSSVPVLIDGRRIIGDSTKIALYLDETYPEDALLPDGSVERARVLALEHFYDEGLGPAIRRYIYGELLRERGSVPRVFFGGYGRTARTLGRLVGAAFEFQIRRMYRIDEGTIAESERVIVDAAQALEKDIESDPTRYLVGGGLTLADVTAASLFAPLLTPHGCPWAGIDPPARVRRLRDELKDTAAGQWVRERYALDRWPAA